jgi:flagellar protein FlaI
MNDDRQRATASEGSESFVLDGIDGGIADEVPDSPVDRGAETLARESVEAAIVDDVVEHFADDYDPAALGIDAPDEASVRARWFDFGYLDDCEVVSWRWSRRPYSYTAIVYDPAENELRYRVETPVLTEFEQYVREDLTRILRQDLMHRDVGAEEERDEIFELEVQRIFDEHAAAVPAATLLRILYL